MAIGPPYQNQPPRRQGGGGAGLLDMLGLRRRPPPAESVVELAPPVILRRTERVIGTQPRVDPAPVDDVGRAPEDRPRNWRPSSGAVIGVKGAPPPPPPDDYGEYQTDRWLGGAAAGDRGAITSAAPRPWREEEIYGGYPPPPLPAPLLPYPALMPEHDPPATGHERGVTLGCHGSVHGCPAMLERPRIPTGGALCPHCGRLLCPHCTAVMMDDMAKGRRPWCPTKMN